MDKQTLIREMEKRVSNAGFINIGQIAKYLKQSRDAVPGLVDGLDFVPTGREKKYFIPDVAGRIMERRIN